MGCLKLAHIEYEQSPLRCVWKSEKCPKTSVNLYDYGARFYDPQLGRFHSVDPLAENYNQQSPFLYAYNNPIRYTDYLGLGAEDEVEEEEEVDSDRDDDAQEETQEEEVKEEEEENKSDDDPETTETTEEDDGNPAGDIMAGTLLLAGAMVVDDATIVGILDDPAIPFVLAGGALIAGGAWIVHEFAHIKKKQSTGKAGLDSHDAQYTHGGNRDKKSKNRNQRKGAERRRNKGKRID